MHVETQVWHQGSINTSQGRAHTGFCVINKADQNRACVEIEFRTYFVSCSDVLLFFRSHHNSPSGMWSLLVGPAEGRNSAFSVTAKLSHFLKKECLTVTLKNIKGFFKCPMLSGVYWIFNNMSLCMGTFPVSHLTVYVADYESNYNNRTCRHGTKVEVRNGVEVLQAPLI